MSAQDPQRRAMFAIRKLDRNLERVSERIHRHLFTEHVDRNLIEDLATNLDGTIDDELEFILVSEILKSLTRPVLVHRLTNSLARTQALAQDLTEAPTDQLFDMFREIFENIGRMRRLTRSFAPIVLDADRPTGSERDEVRVARLAAWLVTIVTRLIPDPQRARYVEEFARELLDLVEEGAGLRRQLCHATSLLTHVGHLRHELRNPRKSQASS
jgi:hypothetical protein